MADLDQLRKSGAKYYSYKVGGLTIVYIVSGDVDIKPEKVLKSGGHVFLYLGDLVVIKPEVASQAPTSP
ncbi:MAG: hypothetical protein ABWJ97_04945 [Thermoproteus sp.]